MVFPKMFGNFPHSISQFSEIAFLFLFNARVCNMIDAISFRYLNFVGLIYC